MPRPYAPPSVTRARPRGGAVLRTLVLRILSWRWGLVWALLLTAGAAPAAAQQADEAGRFELDMESVQGILEIQQINGWLLYDRQGQNPIALAVARPTGGQAFHRWFYLVPAQGEPVLLVHRADAGRFAHLPGRTVEYTDYASLERGLAGMLSGIGEVAMEYSPMAALPDLARVDAGTVELVRAQGVTVRSSADLVLLAKSLWRPEQRVSHYVAGHHLTQLRQAALAFVTERVRADQPVTEAEVQDFLLRGYKVRGLDGPRPIVATTVNAADPAYVTGAAGQVAIQRGDLLLIDMAARVADQPRAVYATTTWMAYVGDQVPARFTGPFAALVEARDAAVKLIEERVQRRRVVKGHEVDRAARAVLERAGLGDAFLDRTGHSLDTDLNGGGANLDDYITRDTRALLMGAGFTVAPGLYVKGEMGMRSAVNVHIGPGGVEVSTPAQTEITPLLAP
ncbi:M24 family metallopeptidase [Haliangium sp.]|uniref:M24 family metallopeptidase n=1 Tax=Haliangium sp. TaxID=2663208 RepID=UPI003D0EC5ED